NNGIQYLSSSTSRFRSKEQGDAPVSDNDPCSDSSSPTKLIQTSPPSADMMATQTTCGLEDVTFKSFICAGGEVEISQSSHCAEDSIVLPQDQDTSNNIAEDTVISDSMVQSCTAQNSATLKRDDREINVTLKSFFCEGAEVEVSDTIGVQDDTIPLPKTEPSEPSQDEAVDLTHFSGDCGQLIQEKHADHPYSVAENDSITVSSTHSENCHIATTNVSYDCAVEPSTLCDEDLHSDKDHIDHPYCTVQNVSSPLCRKLSLEPMEVEMKSVGMIDSQASQQDGSASSPSLTELGEADKSDTGTPQSCGQENVSMFIKSLWRSASRPVLVDDSALEGEKSLLTPVNVHHAGLWAEHLESPIPRPLFNSTALADKPQPDPVTEPTEDLEEKLVAVPQSEEKKPVRDVPLFPEGPLQQQLRQMAEFLFLASGKMGPALASAAATTAPPVGATPVESHSVSVGTSPVKLVDQSLNTSGQFERKREFSVADSCTATEPLLWNLNPGSLECLPRQELEQRLMSSMIMVEALVQQLAAARSQQCVSAGCPPSDLRDKLVQTDHTELSQVKTLTAYMKVTFLFLSQQNSLSSDTDAALSKMKEIGGIITEDHQSLVSHRLFTSVTHDVWFLSSQAFSAMDQLRTHCAAEISELEKSVGSQQELLVALKQIYPEQVQTKISADLLLSRDVLKFINPNIFSQLITVKSLLQKAAPMLLMMNEKAAAALSERDECLCSRDQAIEEREQVRSLRAIFQLVRSDLNTFLTDWYICCVILGFLYWILETGVLQQQLNEKEEETGQLGRKVTELSATVSSTLASYAFLEQALAKTLPLMLLCAWRLAVSRLETSLDQSEQRVCELTQALAQSEEQLGQLQTLHQSQSAEMQQLRDHCTQLKGVQEMNEFLLMENEFAREQVLESEGKLRESLQGLRERNIQCEDLKEEVCQLHGKKKIHVMTKLKEKPSDDSQSKPLLSETSAFTRVAAITPRKGLNEVRAEEEKQSRVAALLSDLGSTVGELISTLKLVQERKDDEKTLAQLVTDVEEAHEALTKYKAENNDLRKDRNDLHRALQQSNVESQFLREELRRAGGQPVNQTQFMEEKIQLLKEVERLKASLQEVEQARAKLLERAKRHQIIHQNNLQKTENELQILNHMINRIREVRDAYFIGFLSFVQSSLQ
uniref:Sperm associated antigen 5 n=1 Tax=Salarias fasciatus TaxID=181472 RepID=A0A672HID1_SALFA